MKLEITGGKGMTEAKYSSIMDGLSEFFDNYYGGYWDVVDHKLSENGMFFAAAGRQPIIDELPEKIEQILLDNGYGLGYGEDQILMALFP